MPTRKAVTGMLLPSGMFFLRNSGPQHNLHFTPDGEEDGQGPREKRGMGYHGEQVKRLNIPVILRSFAGMNCLLE